MGLDGFAKCLVIFVKKNGPGTLFGDFSKMLFFHQNSGDLNGFLVKFPFKQM